MARNTLPSTQLYRPDRQDGVEGRGHVPDEHYVAGHRVEESNEEPSQGREPRPSSRPEGSRYTGELEGTWIGKHTDHAASLNIYRVRGNTFQGILSVHTGRTVIRTDVSGQITGSGRISWQENLVRAGDPDAWDLGSNLGHLEGQDRISGQGVDSRGRHYSWSFER